MNTNTNKIKCSIWYGLFGALSIVLALSYIVKSDPLLAQSPQPSLKDLIKESDDVEQVKKQSKSDTQKPKVPQDDLGRGYHGPASRDFLRLQEQGITKKRRSIWTSEIYHED